MEKKSRFSKWGEEKIKEGFYHITFEDYVLGKKFNMMGEPFIVCEEIEIPLGEFADFVSNLENNIFVRVNSRLISPKLILSLDHIYE